MNITKDEYTKQYDEKDAVGWDFIDKELEKIYPDQEPRHYGTLIKYEFGGNDPLDGISIYDQKEPIFHRHIISYGMSELYYNLGKAGEDSSKWGFEFTFRVIPYLDDEEYNQAEYEPMWAVYIMQHLARDVFEKNRPFEPYYFFDGGYINDSTQISGVAFVIDPVLGTIDTPHGKITFLQTVGLTRKELDWLWEDSVTTRCEELINRMRVDNPLLITDLTRTKEYV
ncbi:suppressor of fused domain protein [Psychrobacter sp. M9-54-1]|uniref:suppressor of fused domain protein n=1 Tax=Psychrobacter sp. M9-54-1 TaxID=2782386 RepID=UPI00190BB324|nr:suppressor of fused domain protein [Psychrobacter sp. M9-54-1]